MLWRDRGKRYPFLHGSKLDAEEPKVPATHLTPEHVEYVAADEILVSLKTKTGELVTYTMSSAALVKSENMSVALINNSTAQVFRDLNVF